MSGRVEGHSQMRARGAGLGDLRGRRRGRAAAGGAARHAARFAAHAAHHPASSASMVPLPSVTRSPPSSTNCWSCGEPFVADAAGDVVRRGRRAEARCRGGFLEWHGSPGLGNALDLLGQLEIDVSVERCTSNCALQIAAADVLVAHVDVGNVALIERVPLPADGVGVGPGHPDAEPRHGRGVRRAAGGDARLAEIEAQARGGVPRARPRGPAGPGKSRSRAG